MKWQSGMMLERPKAAGTHCQKWQHMLDTVCSNWAEQGWVGGNRAAAMEQADWDWLGAGSEVPAHATSYPRHQA